MVSFPLGEGEGVLGEVSFLIDAFDIEGIAPLLNVYVASVPTSLTLPFSFYLPS
jgi:hypothetical protein